MSSKIVSNDVVEKAPGETVERFFDFSGHPEITAGESLSGSPEVKDLDETGDLTISNITIDGSKVHFRVSGGLAKTQVAASPAIWRTDYNLQCTSATDDSNSLIIQAVLRVESLVKVAS